MIKILEVIVLLHLLTSVGLWCLFKFLVFPALETHKRAIDAILKRIQQIESGYIPGRKITLNKPSYLKKDSFE